MKEQTAAKIDSIENIRLVNVKTKKQKMVGHLLLHDNHTIYEWNRVLMQLDKATIETDNTVVVNFQGGRSSGKTFNTQNNPKKVIVKEYCYYFTALNEENAVRKIQNKFNPKFIIVLY